MLGRHERTVRGSLQHQDRAGRKRGRNGQVAPSVTVEVGERQPDRTPQGQRLGRDERAIADAIEELNRVGDLNGDRQVDDAVAGAIRRQDVTGQLAA